MITLKIDVMKIDKSKLYKADSGAVYLDILMIDTPDNKFGNDYMAIQSLSKEDREKGEKGAILGNAKISVKKEPEPLKTEEQDDLPF